MDGLPWTDATRASACIVVAIVAACAPVDPAPTQGSDRELVILGVGDETGRAFLVRPWGDRLEVPTDGVTSLAWAAGGANLLVTDDAARAFVWSGHAEDVPALLHDGTEEALRATIYASPDPRYARITLFEGGTDRTLVVDVEARAVVHEHHACGTSRFIGWIGEGPEALGVAGGCEGTDPEVVHATADGPIALTPVGADEELRFSVAPDGRTLLLERPDRWALYDVETHQRVHEDTSNGFAEPLAWSRDGSVLLRHGGIDLHGYDRGGQELWRRFGGDFGATLERSPWDDRFLLVASYHPAMDAVVFDAASGAGMGLATWQEHVEAAFTPIPGVVIVSTDGNEVGRGEVALVDLTTEARTPLVTGAWPPVWSPTHDSLALGEACSEPRFERLHVFEPDGTPRFAEDCRPSAFEHRWSPDGERLAVRERCEEQGLTRLRLLDASGTVLSEGDCYRYEDLSWSPDADVLAIQVVGGGPLPADPAEDRVHLYDRDGEWLDLGAGTRGGWRPDAD